MGSLQPLNNLAPSAIDTMLLLTDGSVMCHALDLPCWVRLVPDSTGSYLNGAWSQLAPLPNNNEIPPSVGGPVNAPTDFASAVLSDGRVFVAGGASNASIPNANLLTTQIYDPVFDCWTAIPLPPGFTQLGDAPCCLLANGNVLIGSNLGTSPLTAVLDPGTLKWQANTTSQVSPAGETWSLLPNGNVLGVQCSNAPAAHQYNPSTSQWLPAGQTPTDLPQTGQGGTAEMGPAILLPPDAQGNSTTLVMGGSGATALYTQGADATSPGSWTAGPSPSDSLGEPLYPVDAPAVLLPSGTVLFLASPSPVNGPATPALFVEYDSATGEMSADPDLFLASPCPGCRFLLLPNGQVLLSYGGSPAVWIYTPDGTPNPAWAPAIISAPQSVTPELTFTLEGTQLNGLSQACSVGDDAQMATNYPIVRLEMGAQTYYCRTSGFSTMGVATGEMPVSAQVAVPAGVPYGRAQLCVVANGIATCVPVAVETLAERVFGYLVGIPYIIMQAMEDGMSLTQAVIALLEGKLPPIVSPPSPPLKRDMAQQIITIIVRAILETADIVTEDLQPELQTLGHELLNLAQNNDSEPPARE
jgi:hypothetical protein